MEADGIDERDAAARDDAIDLPRLGRAVLARKWWILVPTLAAFAGALVFVTVVSPRYTGVAKVLLENHESYFTRPEKATADVTEALDAEAVQSQAETVATPELARKAINKLGLADKSEFNPSRSGGPLSLILSLFSGGGGANGDEDRIVDNFLSHLDVFPVVKSRVLQIEFVSSDPQLAAKGANTMADLFLASQEDAKKNEARQASAWLSVKIDELRTKVADADAKVEAYRAQNGLLAGANGMTVPGQQLAEINAQIAGARSAQAAALSKAQLLRAMLHDGRLDSIPDVAKDDSLRRYVEQRVALRTQIAEASRTLLPGHPRMKELAGQLAGLDDEIRAATAKVVRGLEDDARLAGSQVTSLEADVARQSKTVAASNDDEVQLRALELDAKATRDQLESYIGKYREAVARDSDNAAPADARVISAATEPRSPTFPKKGPTVLLATLAGFLISLGVVASHAVLAATPLEGAARGSRGETPVPARSATARGPIGDGAAATTAADAIVDRLADGAPEGEPLSLLVTGEGSRGALAVALAAARRLSKRGRTALIDLGEPQAWLSDALDHGADARGELPGLAELLDGRATIDEALHRDLSSKLDIVPAGHGEIDAEQLEAVLEAFRESYAFVVVHASDFSAAAVEAAIPSVAAALICAPAGRLDAALERFRAGLEDPTLVTLGVALTGRAAVGRAA